MINWRGKAWVTSFLAVTALIAPMLGHGSANAVVAGAQGSTRVQAQMADSAGLPQGIPFSPSPSNGSEVIRVAGNVLVGSSGLPLRLVGLDVTGTEDRCLGGSRSSLSWGPTTFAEARDIASWGANAVRVPLNEDCWLGLNGLPGEYSATKYQSWLKQWVRAINNAGMVAILDLQWSAPGGYQARQQWPMPDADHSVLFWSEVAQSFSADPNAIFDLFGEPFLGKGAPSSSDWSCWLEGCETSFIPCLSGGSTACTDVTYQTAGMQQLVDAIRNAGADQPIMLGSLNWSGDPCGIKDTGGNGGTCMWLNYEPHDRAHQLIASFHTYDWTGCANIACWNHDVAPLARFVPIVTGEFGETNCSARFILSFMNWADTHNISYLAWDWEVPDSSEPSRCVSSTNGNNIGTNLMLLSNWIGTPSTSSPEGTAIKNHMQALDLRGASTGLVLPSAATPEVRSVPLLALAAVVLLGWGVWLQRRRKRF